MSPVRHACAPYADKDRLAHRQEIDLEIAPSWRRNNAWMDKASDDGKMVEYNNFINGSLGSATIQFDEKYVFSNLYKT